MKVVKGMGLAICTALLLTAIVGAGSASAAQFRVDEYPTSLSSTPTGEHVMMADKMKVRCLSATMAGTITGASTVLALAPTYGSGCKINGLNASFNPKSCSYQLDLA